MNIDFYGRKLFGVPETGYFEKSQDGLWICRNPSLPINEIMTTMERLNLKLLQKLFGDPDDFWDALEVVDYNISHAGIDSEALCGKNEFSEYMKSASSDERKIVFYYSVRSYADYAQNILNHVMISLGDAYEILSRENLEDRVPLSEQSHGGEHYRRLRSPNCHRIWERISFCVEKIISFLDYLSKYIAEISSINGAVSGRLNTSSVTFGSWGKIKIAKNTALCDRSQELQLITILRDELVHNGTIDPYSMIYEHAIDSIVQRRFILMPDFERGSIHKALGRIRFYKQDNKMNDFLPTAIARVLHDTLLSLEEIDRRIPAVWPNIEKYYTRHKDLHEIIGEAQRVGAFIKHIQND